MAASPLTSRDLCDLALQFEDAHASLLGAQHAYAETTEAVTEAKYALELAKAHRLDRGVDGKNTEQREAKLRLCLADEYEQVHELEREQARAKLELDGARLAWDCLRYRLKAFEIACGKDG